MLSPLAIALGVLASVTLVMEVVLARRALAWLRHRHDEAILAMEGGRVRLIALQAAADAVLAALGVLGGAAAVAGAGGPLFALPAVLMIRAVWGLPFIAWGRGLAGCWNLRAFADEQGRRLGHELAVTLPMAGLVGVAIAGPGGWLAAWTGWSAVVLWREFARFSGRRLAVAPEHIRRVGGENVWITDEGRRSGQLNARAEGIGPWRRIVLNDTLVEALPSDQLRAVVAHEAGHLALRHREWFVGWRLVLALAVVGLAAVMAGGEAPLVDAVMLLLAVPVLSSAVRPLEAGMIRRWEEQADRFAAERAGAEAFAKALEHLYGANRSLPRPEPLWAAFHHPHPFPAHRLAALRRCSTKVGIDAAARPGAG